MAKRKWQSQIFNLKTLGFGFALCVLSFAMPANAAECVVTTPKVVSSGGKLWDDPTEMLVKDGKPLRLGSRDIGPGWATFDLGCFVDHRGSDLRVYEIGKAEGGEVYVGNNLPSPAANGTGWVHLPPICGGKETLPEYSATCPFSDNWLELNIGRDDGARYRYVYLWSAGSVESQSVYGGSPDFDALEVMPPGWSVDLLPANLSSGTVSQYNVPVSGTVGLKAVIYGEPEGEINYRFACDGRTGEFKTGTAGSRPAGKRETLIKNLNCDYLYAGTFYPEIMVRASGQEWGDKLTVYAGVGEPRSAAAAGGEGLKFFLLAMAASVLAWAVYKLS